MGEGRRCQKAINVSRLGSGVLCGARVLESVQEWVWEMERACLGYDPVDDGRVCNKLNHCLIWADNGEKSPGQEWEKLTE